MVEYAEGFNHGYFNFDDEIVNDKASVFSDHKDIKTAVIFNFIYSEFFSWPDNASRIGMGRDEIIKGIYVLTSKGVCVQGMEDNFGQPGII